MSAGPSFRFRLERIRALRERRVDLARQELAKASERLSGSQDRLRSVDERLERVYQDQRVAASESQTVSVDELRERQAFAEHVEQQRSLGRREVAEREAEVSSRTDELGHAAREHQTLERLKERRRAEHERDAARREGAQLDEIAIERFRRSLA